MIFYFSATGNSKYVAEIISKQENEQVISIADAVFNNNFSYSVSENEAVGFAIPTYFYGLPVNVSEFLKKIELHNIQDKYIYLVLTCGVSTGSAGEAFKKQFEKRGYLLSARYSVIMVNNYVPLFKIPNESLINSKLLKAEEKISFICDCIKKRASGDLNTSKGFAPKIMSAVSYPFYSSGRKTKKFFVTDSCIGCGKCENECPSKAITMLNGVPVWTKEQCILCFGCLHRCPKQAIQYGRKTENKGRYVNPNVKM